MSYSLNRAMLIGNLTRDPETRTLPSGQMVCNFGIATSQQWTDPQGQKQERTEFHNLVVWGKLADVCQRYLAKGRKVYVDGRIQSREWEGQDGQKRQRTEINVENMILLDKSGAPAGLPGEGPTYVPTPAPTGAGYSDALDSGSDKGPGEKEIRVEDIPF